MIIKELVLKNYRNYLNLDIQFNSDINVFIGANAQGKTNILEAIYLGAMGHSHRTANDSELIRWEESIGSVLLQFVRHSTEQKLQLNLINSKNKEIILNGNTIRSRDLIGNLNVVLFSPEDLMLVKGNPQGRRRFLDGEISQASPIYYRQLLQYARVVQQRNNLLKQFRDTRSNDYELLEPWDDQLAEFAATIVAKRIAAIKKLTMLANLMHRRITDNKENLVLRYEISGMNADDFIPEKKWYSIQLQERRVQDLIRGNTSVGPHRDDLSLLVNGTDLKVFGSQGQQRTGVLALKLAELEFIRSENGEYPILLLDDVMSELDKTRREQLLLFINSRVQTFITATDATNFGDVKRAHYFHVQAGKVWE